MTQRMVYQILLGTLAMMCGLMGMMLAQAECQARARERYLCEILARADVQIEVQTSENRYLRKWLIEQTSTLDTVREQGKTNRLPTGP